MAISPGHAALLNARPVAWRVHSSAPQVDALVRTMLASMVAEDSLPKTRAITSDELAAVLRCVLLNLLQVRYSDPTRYVSIPMATGAHREGFGYWAQRVTIHWLVKQKLMTFRKGWQGYRRAYWSRIRATDALAKIAAEHEVRPSHIALPSRIRSVELRVADERVEWPDDEESQAELARMEGNLHSMNHCLSQCFIGFHAPDARLHEINREIFGREPESSWIDFSRRELYRVFNDDSRHGGRFYGGWWQAIPKGDRKHIHLAAPGREPIWVVELDFKSIHPTMLYRRVGVAPPADIYDLGGTYLQARDSRDYAKRAVLTLLNADNPEDAEASLRRWLMNLYDKEWRRTHPADQRRPPMTINQMTPQGWPSVRDLLQRIADVHRPIRQFFCRGVAKELMYKDSQVAEKIMVAMFKKRIPVLPVHDSFLVPEGKQGVLERVMDQAFRDENNQWPCPTTKASSEYDVFRAAKGDRGQLAQETELSRAIREENQRISSIYWTLRNDWEMASTAELLRSWPEPDPDDWDVDDE